MLILTLNSIELFDDNKGLFINYPECKVALEHSLWTISKWEEKWHVPFMRKEDKTPEQLQDYISMMVIDDSNMQGNLFERIKREDIARITEYIADPATATTITNNGPKGAPNREIVTSELIYYWMLQHNIPFETQHWHINRLMMLIQVCNAKNAKPQKQSAKSQLSRNAAINAARKKAMGTSG